MRIIRIVASKSSISFSTHRDWTKAIWWRRNDREHSQTRLVNAVHVHTITYVLLLQRLTERREWTRAHLAFICARSTKLGHPWTGVPWHPIRTTETVPLHRVTGVAKYLFPDSNTMEWAFY